VTTHLAAQPDSWLNHAACAGTDTTGFFPDRGQQDVIKQAKAICARCPVRAECLTYAMQNGEKYGIWGGYSEKERRKLRRWYVALGKTA
jgi:WhiB family redox-sensing transcriptional regulator